MQQKNKLQKVELTSVDLVAQGANQDAHIRLYKNRDGAVGTDEPTSVLRKAFDYLRHLFEDGDGEPAPVEKSVTITKADIKHEYTDYIANLQKSFDLVMEDDSYSSEERTELLQKSLCEFHAFMYPAAEKWADNSLLAKSMVPFDEIEKSAETVSDRWACNSALEASVNSIINDDALSDVQKSDMIAKSVDEFSETYKNIFKSKEGDSPMALFDLTDEQVELLKSIFKSADVEAEVKEVEKEKECKTDTCKEKQEKSADPEEEKVEIDEKDIPESVKKAIQKSEDFIASMELKEMEEVAKKYEILGEDTAELAKSLKEMKETNEPLYKSCISMLDKQVSLINKSGLFTEIGKSGVQANTGGQESVAKARGFATEIMKSNPALTYDQAMAKAWDDHPELMKDFDEGR